MKNTLTNANKRVWKATKNLVPRLPMTNYNELVFGEKLCSKSIIKVIEQFIKLVQTSSTFFIFALQVANCYV